jgi:hypothetical protein
MSKRPARFTQAEIRRALAVASKSSVPTNVDILPDGTIRLSQNVSVGSLDALVAAPRKIVL